MKILSNTFANNVQRAIKTAFALGRKQAEKRANRTKQRVLLHTLFFLSKANTNANYSL